MLMAASSISKGSRVPPMLSSKESTKFVIVLTILSCFGLSYFVLFFICSFVLFVYPVRICSMSGVKNSFSVSISMHVYERKI